MKNGRFSGARVAVSTCCRVLAPLLVAIGGLSTPLAASARMLDLGWPPGGLLSQAMAVSGDGQWVMGQVANSANEHVLFRWHEQGGMTVFSTSADLLEVAALNYTGAVMAGSFSLNGQVRAYRWEAGTGFHSLGTLGGDISSAYALSSDGSVVVGGATNAVNVGRAFRWTAALGMQDLGGLTADGGATAYGVSADGSVVVGSANGSAGARAVLWQNGAIQDLGLLGSGGQSEAYAISNDGKVVVGFSGNEAFRWTAATGMQGLGSLGGSVSSAAATNRDGSVVVGSSTSANNAMRAFRWSEATGMVDLGILQGGSYSTAYAVSDDGSVIVGEGDSSAGTRAIVWSSRSAADTVAQDLEHLQESVFTSADTLAQLQAAQVRRTANLATQTCLPGAAQRYCLALRGDAEFAAAGDDSREYQGMLLAGRRLNEQFSMGLNALLARTALNTQGARQHISYGAGLWLVYQQSAASGLGWNAMAGVAASSGQASFKRGEALADVQAASTQVRLTSSSQRLAVGYGMAMGNTVLTPELALTHGRSEHPAFTERHVALPLQVDGTRAGITYASLSLRSATPLDGSTTVHLTLAADATLDDDQPAFTGRSSIPGLTRFAINSRLERRDLLPSAAVQISYALNPQTTVTGGAQVAASPYEHMAPMLGIGAQLSYRF